jgi:hypothetical protein
VNSRTLKTHITSNNKCKLLLMVTHFFHPWTSHPSHSVFYLPTIF